MVLKGLVVVVALASFMSVCQGQEDKRAQMGFMGMRGKKDEVSFEDKRAPMGFNGLRGKKSDDTYDLYEKRSPQMGFMGVRGKKDSQDYLWDIEEDKRAQAGFFGMRGKKGPSGFFGMRGKKGPSGFFGMRGKKGPSGFMGVRGKKDQVHEEIQSLLQQLLDPNMSSLEVEETDPRSSRFSEFGREDGKFSLH